MDSADIGNTTGSTWRRVWNGTFVSVGVNGKILTSPDGITWTSRNSGTTKTLNAITYSDNSYLFVAVGNSGTILFSDNKGLTWTANNISPSVDLVSVTVGAVKNGGIKFIAGGNSSKIVTTTHPTLPWTAEALPTSAPQNANILGIASSGELNNTDPQFVLVGTNGVMYYSNDTKVWKALPCAFSGGITAITHQLGKNFVATGETFGPSGLTETLLTISGATCSKQAAAANATFSGMTYGDGYEVAVGYHKIIYSMQNSLWDWSVVTQQINGDLRSVTFGAGSFLAVGAQGVIYQSTTQQNSGGYQGCYKDDEARALPIQLMSSGATVETCIASAKTKNFAYAGLQWHGTCFAGNVLGYSKVSDGECNTPCSANSSEVCGGSWRNSIYATGITAPPTPAPTYKGCYTDDANRALPVALMSSNVMIESCVAAANARGLLYAGLQYKGQCFAGNVVGYTKVAEAQCNLPCTENSSQICGGSWRNSVYATGATTAPKPSATAYKGCYSDDANRALSVALMSSGATVESCIAAAKAHGFAYAGVQFEGQCYAGNTIGRTKVSDNECNTPCTADKTEKCGGGWRNSIYSTQ